MDNDNEKPNFNVNYTTKLTILRFWIWYKIVNKSFRVEYCPPLCTSVQCSFIPRESRLSIQLSGPARARHGYNACLSHCYNNLPYYVYYTWLNFLLYIVLKIYFSQLLSGAANLNFQDVLIIWRCILNTIAKFDPINKYVWSKHLNIKLPTCNIIL